jgi:hypothetical protein
MQNWIWNSYRLLISLHGCNCMIGEFTYYTYHNAISANHHQSLWVQLGVLQFSNIYIFLQSPFSLTGTKGTRTWQVMSLLTSHMPWHISNGEQKRDRISIRSVINIFVVETDNIYHNRSPTMQHISKWEQVRDMILIRMIHD